MADAKLCTIEDCRNPALTKGMCSKHYQANRKHGSPIAGGLGNGTRLRWLLENVGYSEEGCLAWPFSKNRSGYGYVSYEGKLRPASRVMCILANGVPPEETMQAAHSCGNGHKGCVNPRHLRWATPKENASDRKRHGTLKRGGSSTQAKLTQEQMLEIRDATGTSREIASLYKTTPSTVRRIKQPKHWVWESILQPSSKDN